MTTGLQPYPEYKDSGLPWLGRVPSHWKLRRAKYLYREVDERSQTGEEELCSVSHKTGVTPRKENVTMFMAESTVGYKIVRPNDLAINTLWAWMAALGIARQVGVVSPAYGVYRPLSDSELVPDFADKLLRIEEYKAEYMARSTGINASRLRLYPDQFLRIPLLVPSRDEQVAIAHYLDGMDQKVRRFIRNRRRLIEVLNEQKQAIINRAVTRGLDPNVPLKPSGVDWLREIPEHWAELPLKRIANVDNSGSYGDEPERGDVQLPVATTAQIRSDGHFLVDKMPIRGFSYAEAARYVTNPNDILVVKSSGSVFKVVTGKAGFVDEKTPQFIFSNFLLRIIPDKYRMVPFFLYLLLTCPLTRERIKRMVTGTTYPNLRVGEYMSSKLPIPPRQEQSTIVHYVANFTLPIDDAIRRAQREIDLIREYRTRLIADVVTGKVDVRGLAPLEPADPVPVDDQPLGIEDEGIDDEELLGDDEPELIEEAAD